MGSSIMRNYQTQVTIKPKYTGMIVETPFQTTGQLGLTGDEIPLSQLEAGLREANPHLRIRVDREDNRLMIAHRRKWYAWLAGYKADINLEPIEKYSY